MYLFAEKGSIGIECNGTSIIEFTWMLDGKRT